MILKHLKRAYRSKIKRGLVICKKPSGGRVNPVRVRNAYRYGATLPISASYGGGFEIVQKSRVVRTLEASEARAQAEGTPSERREQH